MRVFVVGATGFIGARLAAALAAEGCEVVRGQRVATRGLDGVVVDFARDRRLEDWLPRLRGVDVVVNAVGILRERRTASFAAVHEQGPAALFEACIRAGVPKVVQISALGAEPDAPTGYFRSMAAGDTLLSKLPLEWVIVQPSLVFGASGASAALLCGLATLPLVPLPGAGDQPVQPIHVDDLVRALVRLIKSSEWSRSRAVAVGPEPLPLREVVASLRRQLGLSPARFLRIPLSAMRLLAQLGGCAAIRCSIPIRSGCCSRVAPRHRVTLRQYSGGRPGGLAHSSRRTKRARLRLPADFGGFSAGCVPQWPCFGSPAVWCHSAFIQPRQVTSSSSVLA
jgi:uncharacterized protein YbjT (DUF2867 family)